MCILTQHINQDRSHVCNFKRHPKLEIILCAGKCLQCTYLGWCTFNAITFPVRKGRLCKEQLPGRPAVQKKISYERQLLRTKLQQVKGVFYVGDKTAINGFSLAILRVGVGWGQCGFHF